MTASAPRTARDRPPEEASIDTSFARGLRILLAVADRGEARADELAVALEMPVSTIYRYLRTLAEFGFVDRRDGRFLLGPRLVIGSGATVTSERLRRHAGPVLRELVERTGETAVVARRVALAAVLLAQEQTDQPLRAAFEPEMPLRLDRGPIGEVLLAHAAPELVVDVLATAGDDVDEPAVRARLADIVRDGGASGLDPETGLRTVAAPVLVFGGIVGAIAVAGPASRCDEAWAVRVRRVLPRSALRIGSALERDAARDPGAADTGAG